MINYYFIEKFQLVYIILVFFGQRHAFRYHLFSFTLFFSLHLIFVSLNTNLTELRLRNEKLTNLFSLKIDLCLYVNGFHGYAINYAIALLILAFTSQGFAHLLSIVFKVSFFFFRIRFSNSTKNQFF